MCNKEKSKNFSVLMNILPAVAAAKTGEIPLQNILILQVIAFIIDLFIE